MFAVSGFTHPFPHKYGHSPGYIIQQVQFYSSLFRTVYSCNGKSACVHGYMPATSRNLLMEYVLLMFPILGWLIHISPSWSPNLFRWNPQFFQMKSPIFTAPTALRSVRHQLFGLGLQQHRSGSGRGLEQGLTVGPSYLFDPQKKNVEKVGLTATPFSDGFTLKHLCYFLGGSYKWFGTGVTT